MAYKVVITKQAATDIGKLDLTIKRQLYKKLVHFSGLDDVKVVARKLHDFEGGEYRLRVGNYRIIFDLDKHTLVILRVQHRKEVYR